MKIAALVQSPSPSRLDGISPEPAFDAAVERLCACRSQDGGGAVCGIIRSDRVPATAQAGVLGRLQSGRGNLAAASARLSRRGEHAFLSDERPMPPDKERCRDRAPWAGSQWWLLNRKTVGDILD